MLIALSFFSKLFKLSIKLQFIPCVRINRLLFQILVPRTAEIHNNTVQQIGTLK